MRPRSQVVGVLAMVGLLVLGGCVTYGVTTTVEEDGTIAEYETEIVMNESDYEAIVGDQTDEEFEEELRSGYDEDNYEEVRANVERVDGEVSMTVTLVGFDPGEVAPSSGGSSEDDFDAEPPDVETTVGDHRIHFVDREFAGGLLGDTEGDQPNPEFEIEAYYELEMPGEILESETNADEIDGNVARWERTGESVNMTVEAVSVRSTVAPEASFTANRTNLTAGGTVEFDASDSSIPVGNVTGYEWDLDGDGNVDTTGERVTHSYEDPGEYEVELAVSGEYGEPHTATRTVTVEEAESESGSGSLPGFGAGIALVALVATFTLLARRRA